MTGLRTNEAIRGNRITMGASPLRVRTTGSWIVAANEKLLFFLFLLTLPLANPWVRGDGVGYYAYLRSVLIDHDLRFENDYLAANESFVMSHTDSQGHLLRSLYTRTGYVENHFSVGPAILWAPVMLTVHGVVRLADHFGGHIPADGYSRPYLLAMAFSTSCYGFLSLLLSYWIARKFFDGLWTFLATVGIWAASSLPIYMYFNPSWSHALSAFTVALFLWYWERTRLQRTAAQWTVLGLLAGLMGNVYYPNAILLIFPALESAQILLTWQRESTDAAPVHKLALGGVLFLTSFIAAMLPTFITRQIIYGSPFESGYPPISTWNWTSPVLLKVLFSSDHGMFSWTPILILAFAGLPFLWKRDKLLGAGCLLTFLAFYYLIASYADWDGLSSYGNRFFVSLTPIFILGLAALLSALSTWLGKTERVAAIACPVLALLIMWNAGLVFQWGTHMVPARGEISWSAMVRNQFIDVPLRISNSLETYFLHRDEMMQHIEQDDINQQKPGIERGE
jgi:hypothetical protein